MISKRQECDNLAGIAELTRSTPFNSDEQDDFLWSANFRLWAKAVCWKGPFWANSGSDLT
jgi:hypothetical protein